MPASIFRETHVHALPADTMPPAPSPCLAPVGPAEPWRLEVLSSYGVLDTPSEPLFDDLTALASQLCGTPIALISLVDRDRQWFKSEHGLGQRQTPLEASICAHAILQDDLLEVPDTLEDPRFVGNPLVRGELGLRFYAGAVLKTSDGLPLGTICVLDKQPRRLAPSQQQALRRLARQTMALLEMRRLLVQAQSASRYRGQLMAIAGHDLKTPLRQASYDLHRVGRCMDPDHPASELLSQASQRLSQIDRQFDQLASLAAAGEHGLAAPGPVDLAEILQLVQASWARPAKAKGLQLRLAGCKPRVLSHRALLTTLVGNLVGNAVKYTERGKVLLGCRRRGDRLLLSVIDTGIGMSEAQLAQCFGAFGQRDPSSEGLGLGLWIARGAADSLGHPLSVRSTLGVGTRFELSLPLA